MGNKRKNQASSVQGLAEWNEGMSRHWLQQAADADTNRRRRALAFRAKQHARTATVLRELIRAVG